MQNPCEQCVYQSQSWNEEPCYRCGSENDYAWYTKKFEQTYATTIAMFTSQNQPKTNAVTQPGEWADVSQQEAYLWEMSPDTEL